MDLGNLSLQDLYEIISEEINGKSKSKCTHNIIMTFLQSKLDELVQKGNKLVLEQIITTIASVADTAEDSFIQHYDRYIGSQTIFIGMTS